MGRQNNTTNTEPVEEAGTGVEQIGQESEGAQRQELESLDPAAQEGNQSPDNPKNDATADATLEGADTPQIIEDPVADATDSDDLSTAAAQASDQESQAPTGPKTHTVKQNETAGEICEKFDVDHITLAKLNPTLNLHCLFAGDTVILRAD